MSGRSRERKEINYRDEPRARSRMPPRPTLPERVERIIRNKFETKYFDSVLLNSGVNTTGNMVKVSTVTQGTALNQRVGGSISPRSLSINWRGIAGKLNSVARFIAFVYKIDDTLGAPTIATILSNGPSGAPDVDSEHNYNNRLNYKILWDHRFYFSEFQDSAGIPPSAVTTKSMQLGRRVIRKGLSKVMNFTPAVNTGEHMLYFFILGDQAASAVNAPIASFNYRLMYKDA